jgi:hypothetical protein
MARPRNKLLFVPDAQAYSLEKAAPPRREDCDGPQAESDRMEDKLKAVLSSLRRGLWRRLERLSFRSLIDEYRPEQHYMRGPGPKTRLKQAAGSEDE